MNGPVDRAWGRFCFAEGLDPVNDVDTRRAFYGGARSVLSPLLADAGASQEREAVENTIEAMEQDVEDETGVPV